MNQEKKNICEKCGGTNTYWHEVHPDTEHTKLQLQSKFPAQDNYKWVK